MDPETLRTTLDSIDRSALPSEPERWATIRSLQKLHRRLMTPMESVKKAVWHDPASLAILRVSVDIRLYHALCKGGGQKTTEELAESCQVDPMLMGRILRELAANDYIDEADVDLWEPTELSKAMTDIKHYSGVVSDLNFPSFTSLPDFYRKYGYKDLSDLDNTPFKFAHNTDLTNFDLLQRNPDKADAFNHFMSGYAVDRPGFSAIISVKKNLMSGARQSPKGSFLIDIGGGKGHDLAKLIKRVEIPAELGTILLQDLPRAIASTEGLPDRIEKMEYDFFTPQPIRGARAYYMHSVIHDWNNAKAEIILRNTAAAMEKGYSKLLIHDLVLPSKNVDPRLTGADILMLCGLGSLERTEKMWHELLQATGFKIVAIHHNASVDPQSVIEAELA